MKMCLAIACVFTLLAVCAACERGDPGDSEQARQNHRADDGEAGAVVLMYHRFGEDAHPSTSVRLEQFDDHLDYLESGNFSIWPGERVLRHLRTGEPFPDRTVAITIDDAYRSVYEEAFPRLRERGWPFTVFVNSDATDEGLADFMSWDQMREMAAADAHFASHSASHGFLVAREQGESEDDWRSRVRADIERGEQRLREELGDAVPDDPAMFAYPYGEYDEALRALVREMGFDAFGQHSGPVGPGADPGALPRFAIAQGFGDAADFRLRVNSRPFPLRSVEPADPTVVDQQNPPVLRLMFSDAELALDRIGCFAGQDDAEIDGIDRDNGVLAVRARGEMPLGRSHYTCTVPAADGRYYWFTQPWLRGRKASKTSSIESQRSE
jgi:poly-beta-1,6-N-acetyl-D-glucosamine N-deacetylase